MFLKIINLLIVTKSAENSKLIWFEICHTCFLWFYLLPLFYLIPQQILKFFLRFLFLKWKLINVLSMFRFFVFYFFLTSSFGSDWKKIHFSLLTLHHIRQGALPLAGCLHAAVYFLCSELLLIAVFVANKTQTWYAGFPCFFFSTLFHSRF